MIVLPILTPTPTLLLAYYATLGPVLAMPIRPSLLAAPIGFVIFPAQPVPRAWIDPAPWTGAATVPWPGCCERLEPIRNADLQQRI